MAGALLPLLLPALAADRYDEAASAGASQIRDTLLEDVRRPLPAAARKAG